MFMLPIQASVAAFITETLWEAGPEFAA